jgi:hypothetical protein
MESKTRAGWPLHRVVQAVSQRQPIKKCRSSHYKPDSMSKYDYLRVGLYLFELLAFITGIIYWKKVRHTHWKWFVVYLGFIFILDSTGGFMFMVLKQNNAWLYKWLIMPVSFLFFFWLYWKTFTHRKEKNWSVAASVIYGLSFIADTVWLSKIKFVYSSFSYCTGNLLLLILIILFFLKFIGSDEILQYKRNMMFWVCIGLLVYYMISLPYFGLWNTLRTDYKLLFRRYWIVQMVLDYLMYIFFTTSFIWGRPK